MPPIHFAYYGLLQPAKWHVSSSGLWLQCKSPLTCKPFLRRALATSQPANLEPRKKLKYEDGTRNPQWRTQSPCDLIHQYSPTQYNVTLQPRAAPIRHNPDLRTYFEWSIIIHMLAFLSALTLCDSDSGSRRCWRRAWGWGKCLSPCSQHGVVHAISEVLHGHAATVAMAAGRNSVPVMTQGEGAESSQAWLDATCSKPACPTLHCSALLRFDATQARHPGVMMHTRLFLVIIPCVLCRCSAKCLGGGDQTTCRKRCTDMRWISCPRLLHLGLKDSGCVRYFDILHDVWQISTPTVIP